MSKAKLFELMDIAAEAFLLLRKSVFATREEFRSRVVDIDEGSDNVHVHIKLTGEHQDSQFHRVCLAFAVDRVYVGATVTFVYDSGTHIHRAEDGQAVLYGFLYRRHW